MEEILMNGLRSLRAALFAGLLTFPLAASAQGPYDGIWMIAGDDTYQMTYQTGTTFVSVSVSMTGQSVGLYGAWKSTFVGTISGNTVTGIWDGDSASGAFTITFTGPNTANGVVNACTPKPGQPPSECPPLGAVLTLNRLM